MNIPHIALAWTDALDIVLTAYFVYGVLLIIRGTRAMQILQGIALLLVLRLGAQYFHLWTVLSLLNALLIVSGVAIPVVFQPELRRALAQLGRAGFHEASSLHADRDSLERICSVLGTAAAVLSRSAIGAIVVLERNAALDDYIESGTKVDALVTPEMLLSLFAPRSPLHDGAVVIKRNRIAAAGCFLPLSEAVLFDRRLGTRHRAALGITEQTDALALIVSEETGDIAIARDGRLQEVAGSPQAVASALKLALTTARRTMPRATNIIDYARTLINRTHVAADGLDKTKL
ncbi:MAG: diadenylate cyclase CdaA [Candidatus Eremiobacter antarcticus]|nr:TIGR00159 family protein [Candidatus Eremiobacteraeota bacterium]MBC5808880.1 TIGR00159 family protein [Candidatus Eremiobacteraeota bacterium]